ncbi:MAG: hypothetical protein FJZ10_01050 [Candidatus Omnitrophica bacterium]|nr:hypothetical protein [Candidatus Omnitrophota bacterium]
MKNYIFYLVILLFIMQGCATPSYMTSREGTIKVGMTKAEVLAIWGEPELKDILGEAYVQGIQLGTYDRWEIWRYPRKTWWAAWGVDLAFSKDGILTSIEPLVK